MRVAAIYREEEVIGEAEPRVIHAVDHDGGGFLVSGKVVGVAIQNFLNNATTSDIRALHGHLLTAFRLAWAQELRRAQGVEDE